MTKNEIEKISEKVTKKIFNELVSIVVWISITMAVIGLLNALATSDPIYKTTGFVVCLLGTCILVGFVGWSIHKRISEERKKEMNKKCLG